ncbi:MAG: rRNA pseudouridine synthase [Acidobacteria bacterium]|nr:rRNA pseudouridine synthase [Acidobacteriota bacterium]
MSENSGERVQKIIARAGICSRRKAEILIEEGRVTVNGKRVTELGTRADISRDIVKVDGEVIHPLKKKVYILLYKPLGVVTTKSDEKNRPTVMDLLGSEEKRGLFPVGRLDLNSEGLLLITNDGEFANYMMSPVSHVSKTYLLRVRGVPDERTISRLENGIILDGVKTRKAKVRMVGHSLNSWLEVELIEGKKNQLRRMFKKVGHPVVKLKRVRIGNLNAEGLGPGRYRRLSAGEVEALLTPPMRREQAKQKKSSGGKQNR